MSAGTQVQGFDYVAGKAVAHTMAEWRDKYPPDKYRRAAEGGETAYYRRNHGGHTNGRAAEAYAIIPAGKAKA